MDPITSEPNFATVVMSVVTFILGWLFKSPISKKNDE